MNTDTLLPIALDLLAKSCGILLLAFTAQSLGRHASAAQRSLAWGATFVVLLTLPLTLLLPPRWSIALESAHAPRPLPETVLFVHENWLPGEAAATAPQAAPPRTPSFTASEIVVGIWMAGAALVLGWRGVGAWQIRRLRAGSTSSHDARALALTARIAKEAGIRRHISLLESARVSVPLTWGVLRPVVLLPRQALAWSDAELESAMRHELGHVRHGDALTRLLGTVACAIYWPNVLVWLAARAWRTAQEQACDDVVLRSGAKAQFYAMQLLHATRHLSGAKFRHVPVMAMAKVSTLEARLSAIMDDSRERRPLRRIAWITGGGSALLLLLLCAALQLRAEEKGKAEPPVPAKAAVTLFTGQVRFQTRLIELPVDTLPSKAGQTLIDKRSDSVAAILNTEEAAALLKDVERHPGVNMLSSPTITTHIGQRAIVETGKHLSDKPPANTKDAPDWEGIRMEMDPKGAKDDKHLDLGLTLVMRQKKAQDAAGKPAFGETRFSRMIVNYEPGTTLVIRGAHPSDTKRELILLVTAEMAAGAAPAKTDDVAAAVPKAKTKADAIIFPHVKFRDATLTEVFDFLRIKSTELDPEKRGVSIVFADPSPNDASITLDLTNVPLSEVLHYVTELANEKFRYDDNAVIIGVPDEANVYETRAYKLPSGVAAEIKDVNAWLHGHGIALSKSSKTKLDMDSSRLTVFTSRAEFKAVDALMEKLGRDHAGAEEGVPADSSRVSNNPVLELAKKIVVPRVQFANATAAEAVEFLRVKSKELDPEKQGVNILLRPAGAGVKLNEISLDLRDVPLSEAVKYVGELARLKVKYEPFAILLEAK